MRRSVAYALVLQLALAGHAVAQAASGGVVYHIDHYTVDDGLAQNKLAAVAQDHSGFIWVGSYRGLQRYDGYSFVRYAAMDPMAPPDLAGPILGMHPDAHGDLWVEAVSTLFHYDDVAGRFERIALPAADAPHTWAADSNGRVWAARGRALYAIERDSSASPGWSARRVFAAPWLVARAVGSSHTGDVWLAVKDSSGQRLVRLNPTSGALTSYALGATPVMRSVAEDGDGRIWIAGDGGVVVLDEQATKVREIPALRGRNIMALERVGAHGVRALSDSGLAEIASDGRVSTEWNTRSVFGVGYLPDAFAFDRDGGVWLATLTTGLFRLDVRAPVFHVASSRASPPSTLGNDFVTGIAESDDATLWISTLRGGAYHVDDAGRMLGAARYHRGDPAALPSDEVWNVAVDDRGTAWLATSAGLCAWENPITRCYGPSTGVFDLAHDREGWLWLACADGIRSFDPLTRRFGAHVRTSSHTLAVFVDTINNDLWVGGEHLGHVRVSHGRPLDSLRLTNSEMGRRAAQSYQIYRSAAGTLWIASDDGLERWEPPQHGAPEHVALPALGNATVFSIAEDRSHALWLGTSHGLVHYVPSTGATHRYARRDGVTTGEFNRHAALVRRDGSLTFGGVDGYLQFRPELVPTRGAQPPVVFTRARRVSDNGIVDTTLDHRNGLTLDRHDRAITIDFAALRYGASDARRYRFLLEGSSGAEWIETNDHSVTYTTPRPGAYRLRVQAAIGEAAWAEPGATLAINVVPPFWRTRWFEALTAIVLTSLLVFLHRLSVGRALATERLRLRISHDLHDEIGAGLSSIALLSDAAGSDPRLTDPARSQLRRIGESARGMVADLRDIIWAIDPGADHVDDVVTRMRDLAGALLPGTRVVFVVPERIHLGDRVTMTARRDLLLLYKEILTNVAKHARATEVRIQLAIASGEFLLTVSDNGTGFLPGQVRRGTGLRSMHARADRLGGALELETTPGHGTTVRVSIRKTRMRRSQPVATQ